MATAPLRTALARAEAATMNTELILSVQILIGKAPGSDSQVEIGNSRESCRAAQLVVTYLPVSTDYPVIR